VFILYFHINDNSTMTARDDPEYDKLFKVRPFVDTIKSSFREIKVKGYNSVDELIIHRRHCSQRGITKCKTLLSSSGQKQHILFSGQGKHLRGKGAGRHTIALRLKLRIRKKLRNTTKVVDDVRYDCVGHWQAHTEKRSG